MSNELKRYGVRVVKGERELSAESVEWFNGDEAARDGLRGMMEEQGYTVERVEIGDGGQATVYLV